MTPQEWRESVGQHIERRRGGRSIRGMAAKAGISESLWRQVESGVRVLAKGVERTVNPKQETRWAICRALDWSDDSIDLLLAGHPQIPLTESQRLTRHLTSEERTERDLVRVQDLAGEDVPTVMDVLESAHDREGALLRLSTEQITQLFTSGRLDLVSELLRIFVQRVWIDDNTEEYHGNLISQLRVDLDALRAEVRALAQAFREELEFERDELRDDEEAPATPDEPEARTTQQPGS